MKAATFNANSIRSRSQIICNWLSEQQPDILCVQETKVQDVDFPVEVFAETGCEFVFKGQKSYNGVAIFSREKFSDVRYGLDGGPADEARMIAAQTCGITVVNTYVPQGTSMDSEKYQYKLDWLKRLRAFFDNNFKPSDKILWLGDFNIAPTDIDVYDPAALAGNVCFNEQMSEIFADFLDWGFTDLFRLHNPQSGCFSFWDYRQRNGFARNLGWRLDHILATEPLAKNCVKSYIDTAPRKLNKPSDHTFVVAEIDNV